MSEDNFTGNPFAGGDNFEGDPFAPKKSDYAGKDPGVFKQFLGGAKHAWDRAAYGLESLFGGESLKPLVESGAQFVRETGPASTIGQVAGDIAMSAAPSVRAVQLGRMAAPVVARMGLPRAAGLMPLTADMAAQAGYGALTNPEDRSSGAAMGAVGAGVGNVLSSAITRGLPGVSAKARELMDTTNIQPTVGMAVPKLKAIEEFSQRVPIVGEFTKSARNRALNEFTEVGVRRAVGDDIFDAIASKGGRTSEELLDAANDYVSSRYDRVVPFLQPKMDHLESMAKAYHEAMARPYMSELERSAMKRVFEPLLRPVHELDAIMRNPLATAEQKATAAQTVLSRSPYGNFTGKDIKQFDSELGAQIRKYHRSPATEDLGDAMYSVQRGLRDSIERNLPEDLQGIMGTANQGYRDLVAINKAASQSATGQFTPRQLNKAVAARDKVEPTRTRGGLAEFAKDAQTVLPSTIADPHYSGAGLAGGLLGFGGAAMLTNLPTALAVGTGIGVGSLRPAQAALLGNTRLQKLIAERLRQYPIQGAAGAAAMNSEE